MIKKSIIFILIFLFFLLIPVTSAVVFDMKSNFNQGETLLAKISGYFLEPIIKENVLFYKAHVRIPMEYDIAKIDEDYYLYADLSGKNPNNYSVVIKNTRHMEFTEVSEEDIVKNFSINENRADFSINLGFVVAEEDFSIEARNLQNNEISIKIKINPEEKIEEVEETEEKKEGFFSSLFKDRKIEEPEENQSQTSESSVVLKPGQIEEIIFSLESLKQGLNIIELSTDTLSYEIPVFVSLPEELQEKERDFEFQPTELNISLATNSTTSRILYLYNTGKETLENISISVSNSLKPYINLSTENIPILENGSNFAIEISVLRIQEEKTIEGHIKAKTNLSQGETLITYSQIFLSFLKGYVPLNDTGKENIRQTIKTCSEINGIICQTNQKCDGEVIDAKDGICCLGNCREVKKSPAGRIIGILIFVIIVGALIWFYRKKYKGAKKPVDLLKIAKGK